MSDVQEHKIDRAGWPPGPWDAEPDKLVWTTAAGLPGMIVRAHHGALCGYVAIAKDHPLYGVDYSAGEYPDSPEGRFRVHGGLTYSEHCQGSICHVPEPGQPDDVWWFGFDCAHSGDLCPAYMALPHRARVPFSRDTYRDVAYVRAEVEDLASQLARAAPLASADTEKGGTP